MSTAGEQLRRTLDDQREETSDLQAHDAADDQLELEDEPKAGFWRKVWWFAKELVMNLPWP